MIWTSPFNRLALVRGPLTELETSASSYKECIIL